jgi:hypothetical protein
MKLISYLLTSRCKQNDPLNQTTRCHIPEGLNLNIHSHWNLTIHLQVNSVAVNVESFNEEKERQLNH